MFWLGMQLCDLVIVRIVPEIRVPQTSRFSEKKKKKKEKQTVRLRIFDGEI